MLRRLLQAGKVEPVAFLRFVGGCLPPASTRDVLVIAWRICGRDRPPGVPGDLDDQGGDGEADDRITDVCAERDDAGAGDHAEGDEPVDPGVVAIGDEGWTGQVPAGAEPHLGRNLVAEETDRSGGGEEP